MAIDRSGDKMRSSIENSVVQRLKQLNHCCSLGGKLPLLVLILLGYNENYKNNIKRFVTQFCIKVVMYEFEESEDEEIIELTDFLNNDSDVVGVAIVMKPEKSCSAWDRFNKLSKNIVPSKLICGYNTLWNPNNTSLDKLKVAAIKHIIVKHHWSLVKNNIGFTGNPGPSADYLCRDLTLMQRNEIKEDTDGNFIKRQQFFTPLDYTKCRDNKSKIAFKEYCKKLDIVICDYRNAPKIISADMLKPKSSIIDAGVVLQKIGNEMVLVGNTDCDPLLPSDRYLLPTPGTFLNLLQPYLIEDVLKGAFDKLRKIMSCN